jgi:hypothetical protein
VIESFKRFFIESNEGKIKLSQKASIFSFCLLLSTFFWFLSSLSKNYTTDLSFPIEYIGYSNDFILTEEPSDFVEGQVFGSGYELLGEQISLNRKAIKVDLKSTRKTKTKNLYFIETKKLREEIDDKLDQDIQLQFLKPDTLYFKTQVRVSKLVPIIALIKLDFDGGYQLRGEVNVTPTKIKVSGPKSYIDTLQVLYTEKKEVNDIDDSTQVELQIKFPEDINGLQYDSDQVEVFVPVEKFTEKEIELDLLIHSNSSSIDLKTFPSKVKVKTLVPISLYENLDESLLKASVYFNTKKDMDLNKLEVKLKGLPKYAKLIRIEPERVEYILRK